MQESPIDESAEYSKAADAKNAICIGARLRL